MSSIKTVFSKKFEELLTKHHLLFQKARSRFGTTVYARVVNDILQAVELESLGQRRYDISFGVAPLLCAGNDGYVGGLTVRVGDFFCCDSDPSTYEDPWRLETSSSEEIEKIVEDICEKIEEIVIPFFEKANTCKAAFQALMDLYWQKELVRRKWLYIHSPESLSAPMNSCSQLQFKEQLCVNSDLYNFAIKNLDFEFMEKYINYHIKRNQESVVRMKNEFPAEYVTANLYGYIDSIVRNSLILERIKARDELYFQEHIAQREKESLKKLQELFRGRLIITPENIPNL